MAEYNWLLKFCPIEIFFWTRGTLWLDKNFTSLHIPLLVRRQNWSEQFVLVTYGLNQWEYTFGDPSWRTISITKAWAKTYRICLVWGAKDITSEYLEWRTRRFKYVNLPSRDETVQPVDLQPRKVFIEVEIWSNCSKKKIIG